MRSCWQSLKWGEIFRPKQKKYSSQGLNHLIPPKQILVGETYILPSRHIVSVSATSLIGVCMVPLHYVTPCTKTYQFLHKETYCIAQQFLLPPPRPFVLCSWKILFQHQVCHDCPHRHITCDHPVAWFVLTHIILWEITPFQPCDFCYTTLSWREAEKMGI